MKKNLISVIIPLYNTEQYIERCIKSIVENSYKDIEVLVVDDGSTDNSKSIVTGLCEIYENVKLVPHEKNMGLFQARITGFLASEGEYIAYVDADDYVTCDWFRMLHSTIVENDADIAIGQFVLDNDKYGKSVDNLDPLRQKIVLTGDEVMDAFMSQRGLYYSWQLVWNKLYKRELWENALSDLQEFSNATPHLVMCEDVAFSAAIWCRAKKVANFTNGAFYYYFKHEGQSTQITNDIKKNTKNIINVGCVFNFMYTQLKKANLFDLYESDFTEWKLDYAHMYYANYSEFGKTYYSKLLTKHFDLPIKTIEKERPFNVMYTINSPLRDDVFSWNLGLKNSICDSEVQAVSFDIFDTLVVRPFLRPTDLLKLLNPMFLKLFNVSSYYDFAKIRIDSEAHTRELQRMKLNSSEDVTLDEIYDQIHEDYKFDKALLEKLKQYECELEIKMCYRREAAFQLFELAKHLGKKIFITSDMYLPREVIEKILEKNGYNGYDKLFLSCEIGLTKHSKNLFKYALKETNLEPKSVIHIGDNWDSDVANPQSLGMKSFHLPKTTDILFNYHPTIYGGRIMPSVKETAAHHDLYGTESYFIGYSAMAGLIANKLFDNPYISYNPWSDFNADPGVIGYASLGPYLYAVTDWIRNTAIENNTPCVHFVARDGYLPMKAFEQFKKYFENTPESNYLYVSRKSMIFSDIYSENDIYSLTYKMNSTSSTPKNLLKLFREFLPDNIARKSDNEIYKIVGVSKNCEDIQFPSQLAFEKTVQKFYRISDHEKIKKSRDVLTAYFKSIIKEGDMMFDIGYSGRQEASLSQMLGFPFNSMYLHSNNDMLNYRKAIGNFKTNLFYEHKPRITGVIREHAFMKLAPSATGYIEHNGKLEPKFEEFNLDRASVIITDIMQSAALEFVNDFLSFFKDNLDTMYYRKDDFAFMFEYYLHYSKNDDKRIFGGLLFEDDLGTGMKLKALDFWQNECNTIRTPVNCWNNGGAPAPSTEQNQEPKKRRVVDFFLPKGTRRREFVKKILKKNRK